MANSFMDQPRDSQLRTLIPQTQQNVEVPSESPADDYQELHADVSEQVPPDLDFTANGEMGKPDTWDFSDRQEAPIEPQTVVNQNQPEDELNQPVDLSYQENLPVDNGVSLGLAEQVQNIIIDEAPQTPPMAEQIQESQLEIQLQP